MRDETLAAGRGEELELLNREARTLPDVVLKDVPDRVADGTGAGVVPGGIGE